MKKIILLSIFIASFLRMGSAAMPRYISLAPSTTEILFALGLNEEIVGVSTYCNYPPEVKGKVKVGSFSSPSMEKIIALKPDHIFCTGLEQAPVITQLRQLNFKVYVSDPTSMEELFDSIREIGKLTNRSAEAIALTQRLQDEVATVTSKAQLIPLDKRVRVFIEIWHEPLMTAAGGSIVDELITLAGGINIAHDLPRPYCNISSEKVISLDPQCIIMAYMDKEPSLKLLKQRFGWDKIEAVKNQRAFNDIDPDTLLRPGPRITQGLVEVYKRLYPQG
ncbi:MAG: cobalamin-binding protein [Candidatus Omnitrophica bacterium]|nr:cobalamin-binding protein [Candidatus Omnitrophota bacterium]